MHWPGAEDVARQFRVRSDREVCGDLPSAVAPGRTEGRPRYSGSRRDLRCHRRKLAPARARGTVLGVLYGRRQTLPHCSRGGTARSVLPQRPLRGLELHDGGGDSGGGMTRVEDRRVGDPPGRRGELCRAATPYSAAEVDGQLHGVAGFVFVDFAAVVAVGVGPTGDWAAGVGVGAEAGAVGADERDVTRG